MDRRDFLTASLAGVGGLQTLGMAADKETSDQRQVLEWRIYQTHVGAKSNLVGNYYRDAGITAMNRLGVGTVGVFNVTYGQNSPSLWVLLVHPSLESLATLSSRLLADKEHLEKAAGFINAELSDPAYVRYESQVMAAFKGMPKLEVPAKKDRLFELRIYESHSEKASKKKVEMFNEGGEIELFRKTGLTPVFFGETVIGRNMPNLNYMLVFDDMADRDARWKVFVASPGWKTLSADPQYKDTVSNITDIILRPTAYSQI
jgi:hypothetical protein